MQTNVKISVILSIYNMERYLSECLDSIQKQSLKDIEIICVDDGSTDHSLQILQEKAQYDERIKIYKQSNRGAAAARNLGFQYSKGNYVIFLDSDDFFHRKMLEKAFACAEKHQSDVVIFRSQEFDEYSHKYHSTPHTIKKNQLPANNPFTYRDIPDYIFTFALGWAWDKLYRREFVEKNHLMFQEIRTSNDLYFVFSSLVKADSIYVLNRVLAYHRTNLYSSLSMTRERSWDCFYIALSRLKEELEAMQIYSQVERGFLNWVVDFAFWHLNTITGPAYKKVFLLIKNECFPKLGMDKKDESYFFNSESYMQMQELMQCEYEEYIFQSMVKYRKQAELLAGIDGSRTFKAGKLLMWLPVQMRRILRGER
ncbi:MAG: glycosyltransferase [Lachnospiraceae bacterium]|nr:glycosyltransferase [Lachnospiraceae bacterium]